MQIQLKNMVFITVLACCAVLSAQSETAQFISLVSSYYKNLTADSTFCSATELSQIRKQLPRMQKAFKTELIDQKKHAKNLKLDTDATHNGPEEESVEKARLQLQATLRESQDISPLKTAIAQAQWILSPQKEPLNRKAIAAASYAQDAKSKLTDAEEELDSAWQKLQQN